MSHIDHCRPRNTYSPRPRVLVTLAHHSTKHLTWQTSLNISLTPLRCLVLRTISLLVTVIPNFVSIQVFCSDNFVDQTQIPPGGLGPGPSSVKMPAPQYSGQPQPMHYVVQPQPVRQESAADDVCCASCAWCVQNPSIDLGGNHIRFQQSCGVFSSCFLLPLLHILLTSPLRTQVQLLL